MVVVAGRKWINDADRSDEVDPLQVVVVVVLLLLLLVLEGVRVAVGVEVGGAWVGGGGEGAGGGRGGVGGRGRAETEIAGKGVKCAYQEKGRFHLQPIQHAARVGGYLSPSQVT